MQEILFFENVFMMTGYQLILEKDFIDKLEIVLKKYFASKILIIVVYSLLWRIKIKELTRQNI